MKQTMNRLATGIAWSLVTLAGISLFAAPEASAHDVTRVRYVDYDYYPYRQSTHIFPRWLRAKQDFQRWYSFSHYRYMRRLSWQRLYDLYLYDKRYSRHAWRYDYKYHDRHYGHDNHDHDRRDRNRKRKKRG